MFKELKGIMFKELKESMVITSYYTENNNEGIEIIKKKKNQMEILE